MTFRFIDAEKQHHQVARLCRCRVSPAAATTPGGERGALSERFAQDVVLAAKISQPSTPKADGTYGGQSGARRASAGRGSA